MRQYIAYCIQGGQQVFPRSTWYSTEGEALKAGKNNAKSGEAIGVVHTDMAHPFDTNLLKAIRAHNTQYGDRYS